MEKMMVTPIGTLAVSDSEAMILIAEEYRAGLTGLADFSYVQVLWWFDRCDTKDCRLHLTEEQPYVHGPELLGTFATRSPMRPNPIALSCAEITYVDLEKGEIGLTYIDALDGSPVLDLKPYTPSLDRVETPSVPEWCEHWPNSVETSGEFDWEKEFNF
ncbi:MAG: SAM-dependent methyltransferase [bacterium]|nr:SAM-dependent methyltransferase [bacterium]